MDKTRTIIGAQYKGRAPEKMTIETIVAATWAVFSVVSTTGIDHVPAAFPNSVNAFSVPSRFSLCQFLSPPAYWVA